MVVPPTTPTDSYGVQETGGRETLVLVIEVTEELRPVRVSDGTGSLTTIKLFFKGFPDVYL